MVLIHCKYQSHDPLAGMHSVLTKTRIIYFYYNIESVPELTKNQVLMRMKTSAVARTAVYQWNRMNTALRVLVHQTTVCSCITLSGNWLVCSCITLSMYSIHNY